MIDAIYDKLRNTFNSGKTKPIAWRLSQLRSIRRFLNENREELIHAVRQDLGHGLVSPGLSEILAPLDELDHTEAKLSSWMSPEAVSVPGRLQPANAYLVHEPLGVVLLIAPWNYPLNLCIMPLIGAIAGGNCAVVKPSEVAEHTAAAVLRLLPRYMDPDAIAVVVGGVEETTHLLKYQWDHILYTGNGQIGRIVMEAAAKHLTPVTLELGGKSPVYVDKNVNLDVAANRIAWGKYMNCGQTCIAPDYVMVHKDVYDEFVKKVVNVIQKFYGTDPKKSGDYSRIINTRHTKRLQNIINAEGNGKLVVGGSVEVDNKYIPPTVFRDVPLNSELMKDELFGPVMPTMSVNNVDEAIAIVNARPKPLALYVFTNDNEVKEKVIQGTAAGAVCVNETIMHVTCETLPFGGVGPSGIGSYHGKFSFHTFTHAKPVLDRAVWVDPKGRYPPYPKDMIEQLEKLSGILKTAPTVAKGVAALALAGFVIRSRL